MVAPGIDIRLFDLSVFAPQITTAIFGMVGPATKGPVNQLNEFTQEGNFIEFHGRPVDRQYGPRAAIRYFRAGNQLKYVRIAGPNLATATVELTDEDGNTILTLSAASPGTWANDTLRVSVTYNGDQQNPTSYNIDVYQTDDQGRPQLVEQHVAQDNGIVVSTLRNNSNRIRGELARGAGATFPERTVNPVTGEVTQVAFSGGDDGAFAKTKSEESSTSGLAGKRFYGKMDSSSAQRVWHNVENIGAALSGQSVARGNTGAPGATAGIPVVPGTFTIRLQTGASAYTELSDDEDLSYAPGGAGVGILTDPTDTAVGFINYVTGEWGADISALAGPPTLFAGGTIDAIFVRAAQESVGSTVRGQGAYAGNLSTSSLAPGFFNANKLVLQVPVDEQVGITPTASAAAASSDADLKTLAGWIVPGTVKLTPANDTDPVPPPIWDDGFGGFRTAPNGGGVVVPGTIDYRTGAWSVTTWDPVGGVTFAAATTTTLQATYKIQLLNMGGGAVPGQASSAITQVVQASDDGVDAIAADTDTGAQRIAGPISPGSVKLTISDVSGSPFVVYDDGVGGWLDRPRGDPRAAAVTGSVDYTTGAWTVTASATITAAASVTVVYTSDPLQQARRNLRGTGPQFRADTTANAAGVNLDDPADANNYNGTNWLDHETGAFAFEFDLVTTGDRTFDVEDNAAISAAYLPADIVGFGDGSTVLFPAQIELAPFRREEARLQAFQSAQASVAGAGEPQVTFSDLGADADNDFWSQNVVSSTDPENTLDYRTGEASIKWTGAPLLDEAVFVVRDEIVLHLVARFPGDIGNERDVVTDGFRAEVDEDPTLAGTLRLRVLFETGTEETFGQAEDLDELVDKVNDPTNGSNLLRAEATGFTGALAPDVAGFGGTGSQVLAMSGAFTIADVIGTKVGQTTTGLQMFRNDETVPLNWISIPGQWHRQAIIALQELCERKARRCIGVIPAPDADNPFDHRDFFNGSWQATSPGGVAQPTVTVPFPPLAAINSTQLATIVPWVQYFDQFANSEVFEPADGEMAMLVAGAPAPWFPVAGLRRGRVRATSLRYSASREDRELLQDLVGNTVEIVNPIVRKEGRGLVLLGQQTAARTKGSLDRINVRWTINVIMNLLDVTSQEFLFEINDAILWREITAQLNAVLRPIIARRGLRDAFVAVDATTTTPEDIDALRVNAKLFIKPQKAAEFITYDLILTPAGADFADVVAAG